MTKLEIEIAEHFSQIDSMIKTAQIKFKEGDIYDLNTIEEALNQAIEKMKMLDNETAFKYSENLKNTEVEMINLHELMNESLSNIKELIKKRDKHSTVNNKYFKTTAS